MNKHITLLCLLCLPLSILAQEPSGNLVKNYSFESIDGKVKGKGDFDAVESWFSTTGVGADIYSKEFKGEETSAPDNVMGREKPIDGNNFAGAMFYAYKDGFPRSYITGELKKPLEAGKKYCVTFNVSLSEYSKYAVNNIGALLSKDDPKQDGEGILSAKPSILHSKNAVYTEQYTWEQVCGVYEAAGGEAYISIGNYGGTKETQYKKMKRPKGFMAQQQNHGYYFIENVTIVPFTTIEDCKCEKEEFVDDMNVVYSRQVTGNTDDSPVGKIGRSLVYFAEKRTELDLSGKHLLDEVVKLMQENVGIKVQLLGHMDENEFKASEAVVAYQTLGIDRANAVKDYLIEKGIEDYRISTGDMKNMDPANVGTSDIEMAKNRRVEFVVSQ